MYEDDDDDDDADEYWDDDDDENYVGKFGLFAFSTQPLHELLLGGIFCHPGTG